MLVFGYYSQKKSRTRGTPWRIASFGGRGVKQRGGRNPRVTLISSKLPYLLFALCKYAFSANNTQ